MISQSMRRERSARTAQSESKTSYRRRRQGVVSNSKTDRSSFRGDNVDGTIKKSLKTK